MRLEDCEAMINKTLNKEQLKDSYSSRTYYRGHTYYKQGRVLDLEYNEQTTTWTASVRGAEMYTVMVEQKEILFIHSAIVLLITSFQNANTK